MDEQTPILGRLPNHVRFSAIFVREWVNSPAVGLQTLFSYHSTPNPLLNRKGQHCLAMMKRRKDGSDV